MRNLKNATRINRANKIKSGKLIVTETSLHAAITRRQEIQDLKGRHSHDLPTWYLKQSSTMHHKSELALRISAPEFLRGEHHLPFFSDRYNGIELDIYHAVLSIPSYLPGLLLNIAKNVGAVTGSVNTDLDIDLFMQYSDVLVDRYSTFSAILSNMTGFTREHFHLVELKDMKWGTVLDKEFFTEEELLEFIPEISKSNSCFHKSIKAKYSKEFWFKVFMEQD